MKAAFVKYLQMLFIHPPINATAIFETLSLVLCYAAPKKRTSVDSRVPIISLTRLKIWTAHSQCYYLVMSKNLTKKARQLFLTYTLAVPPVNDQGSVCVPFSVSNGDGDHCRWQQCWVGRPQVPPGCHIRESMNEKCFKEVIYYTMCAVSRVPSKWHIPITLVGEQKFFEID